VLADVNCSDGMRCLADRKFVIRTSRFLVVPGTVPGAETSLRNLTPLALLMCPSGSAHGWVWLSQRCGTSFMTLILRDWSVWNDVFSLVQYVSCRNYGKM